MRVLAGVLAALQLFVGAAVPILDAEAGHHQPVAMHIEDATQDSCPAAHDAASCQLCQLLTAVRGFAAGPGVPDLPAIARRVAPVADQPVALAAGFLDGHASRAPPLG